MLNRVRYLSVLLSVRTGLWVFSRRLVIIIASGVCVPNRFSLLCMVPPTGVGVLSKRLRESTELTALVIVARHRC